MPILDAALPPLYSEWMRQLLGVVVPGEKPATCRDCAMCAHPGDTAGSTYFYRPETKCCTYLPRLWNFLTGRILADESPEASKGRASVVARLEARVGVTPLGLEQTPMFTLLYHNVTHHFGRLESLRCPHYLDEDGGLCGVWRHRESTCATWFCKHERGQLGDRFFDALHWLLVSAEVALSRWAVLELDVGAEALALLLPPASKKEVMSEADFENRVDDALYRRKWGKWAGREREFFLEAARLVGRLGWTDVRRIGGPDLGFHEAIVREAHGRLLSMDIPDHLMAAPVTIERTGDAQSTISTYNGVDPLSVPVELIGVLHYFDGRDTAEILEEIRQREGLDLEPALVRRLADFGILKPA